MSEVISIAVGAVVALGVLVSIVNVWRSAVNERRRAQPIVIAHETHGRQFADGNDGYFAVGAYVTSEGGGPAFNVRVGVEFGGVRYPHKLSTSDPDSGYVERVLRSGQRKPPDERDELPIFIPQTSLLGLRGGSEQDDTRVYWSRYENVVGQTWETRNPWQGSARLRIHRVRARRLREWWEQRKRVKAGASGAEWEAKAFEMFRQAARAELKRRGLPLPDESD